MMRVKMTEEQKLSPVAHLASLYAGDLVSAGLGFSTACYQHSKLSLREFEGARVRTAQINGCEVCQNWRSERDLPGYFAAFDGDYANSVAAHGRAPDDAFYGAIAGWRTADMFTPRERLAIEYAEGLGRDPHGIAQDEDFWKRLKAFASDEEVVDLSYCIAAWMGVGRVTHALGMDSVCQLNLTAVAA